MKLNYTKVIRIVQSAVTFQHGWMSPEWEWVAAPGNIVMQQCKGDEVASPSGKGDRRAGLYWAVALQFGVILGLHF